MAVGTRSPEQDVAVSKGKMLGRVRSMAREVLVNSAVVDSIIRFRGGILPLVDQN